MRLAFRLLVLALAGLLAACGPGGGRAVDEPVSSLSNAGEPAAAPDPRLDGRWIAVLTTSVEPRPLDLRIDLSGPQPSVTLTAPDQGDAVIAFEQVRLDGAWIGFATPLGALRFEGALAGDDQIAGEIFQGGLASALTWSRAS